MSDEAANQVSPDEIIAAQRTRQVLILTGVIVVLAALVFLSNATQGTPERAEPVPLVPSGEAAFTRETIEQIEIWRAPGKPLMLKRGDGGWRIPEHFGAPAQRTEVDGLLNKVFEAKRLGRASTHDTTRYALYQLADDDATHLMLRNNEGKELLHILVGRGEDGSRDFVRLTGPEAPEGIFEIANPAGSWDTLYARLNLDAEGRPDTKRWLDLSGFKPVPEGAKVGAVTIHDDETTLEVRRDAQDEAKWQVVRPGKFDGDTTAIQGLITTIEGMAATDVAGRDTDAASLGITDAGRRVILELMHDGKPAVTTLLFGERKDGNVAVLARGIDQGTLVHRVGEHVLERIFRKLTDFVKSADVGVVPFGREPASIRVVDGEKLLELEHRASDGRKDWMMTTPLEAKADRMAVSVLTNRLNTLRGALASETPDVVALGVDPSLSTRWLEVAWMEPGEKKEGEEAPADVRRTGALYLGKPAGGLVPALKRGGNQPDQFFWLDSTAAGDLFVDPLDYRYYEVKVRQVLISWKGKHEAVTPKDPERTEEQARALAANIIERARGGEEFVEMQKLYNEDSVADNVYDVTPESGFVEPFKKLAARLEVGAVDICESQFGLHILKRVE